MDRPGISVIIRARDEAASIGRCLDLVGEQRAGGAPVEVIVVDSGSRDSTIALADERGARVISIPPHAFTFGRALNLGAAEAAGEILVALSAHAFPLDAGWLARLTEPFADPRVACASGDRYLPDGTPLTGRVRLERTGAREHPQWGYSNAAGAFRASLWRARPFSETLPGAEDKEWARYWLERGYVCVIDRSLAVDHDHTHDPSAAIYRRARREEQGFAAFLEPAPYGPRELVREWWGDLRFYDSPLRARLSYRRAARLLGAYAGRRTGRRGRI